MTYSLRPRHLLATALLTACLSTSAFAGIVTWNVDIDGQWTLGTNWNPGLPGAADTVTIDRGAANPIVTLSSGAQVITSLVDNERLTLSGGTLTSGSVTVGGSLTMSGGTLMNALLSTTGAGKILITSGAFSGVTSNADLDLTATSSALTINNNFTLNGTATLGHVVQLAFTSSQTLSGTGTILFSNGINALNPTGNNTTLTLGSGITVRGGAALNELRGATIGNNTFFASGATTFIVNLGTINADTAGMAITIRPGGTGSFTNSGTIMATNGATLNVFGLANAGGTTIVNNGILNLGGSLTQSALGTFIRTGGTVNLTGTLVGNLNLDATTGSWNLANAAFSGGTITTAGTAAVVATNSNNTLNAITLNGALDLSTTSTAVTITNNLILNGTTTLGHVVQMSFPTSQSITGTGTVLFGNGINALNPTGNNTTLTLGAGITVRGGAALNETRGATIGNNTFFATGATTSIVNLGTINADTAGMAITIRPGGTGSFTNSGTIMATNGATLNVFGLASAGGTTIVNNGILNLGGSLTQSALGAFIRTGGTVNLTGTLVGNLNLDATTGSWNIANAAFSGGTITTAGTAAVVVTNNNNTLNAITLNGTLDLTTTSTGVTITNNLILNSTTTLGHVVQLAFPTSQSITGTGTVLFGNGINALNPTGNNTTLTLGSGITVRGGAALNETRGATIGNNTFFATGATTSIVNLGTINADTAGMAITIRPGGTGSFTNSGTIMATNGATLNVFGLANAGGTTIVNNGILNLGGSLTQSALGTFVRTGGTVNLTGSLSGNLALSAATGSWNLLGGSVSGGTLTAADGAKLVITTSGGTLDAVTSNIDLDLSTTSSFVNITNGLTLNGTATLGHVVRMTFATSSVLNGTGTILFQNGINALNPTGNGTTLTIGPGITVRGGAAVNELRGATIGDNTFFAVAANCSILNQGTINADTAGFALTIRATGTGVFNNAGTLIASNGGILNVNSLQNNAFLITATNSTVSIAGSPWTNSGTISATNSIVNLGGTFSQAGLGTFIRSGGTVNLTGALTGNLTLDATTGSWNLAGGSISNATINATGGAKIIIPGAGSTLNNVVANTDLDLLAVSANLTLLNNLTLNGTLTMLHVDAVIIPTSQTISGTGTILFGNGINGLILSGNNTTLTLGPGLTLRGGGTDSRSAGLGANGFNTSGNNISIVSQGTINTETVGSAISVGLIGSGNFLSSGSIIGPGNFNISNNAATSNSTATISGLYNVTGTTTLTNVSLFLNGGGSQTAGRIISTSPITIGAGAFLTSNGILASSLTLNGNLTVRPNATSAGTSKVNALTLAKTGSAYNVKLDLTNNKLILQGADAADKALKLAAMSDAVNAGRNGGNWLGNGITSSTVAAHLDRYTVVVVDGADYTPISYGGQTVNSNSVLVATVILGDGDLSGIVDAADFDIWFRHVGASTFLYTSGDFDHSGIVDAADFDIWFRHVGISAISILADYGLDAASAEALGTAPLAAVPEPASLALLAFGGAAMLTRRRKRPH